MNDMVKGFRPPKTMRKSDRIRKGIMPKQRKNAIAKTAQPTASKVEAVPVPVPKDVLPKAEIITAYGAMNVEVGQNTIFADNTGAKSTLRLTDVGIAEVWNKAWPNRKIVVERGGYSAKHVVGARRDYNKGKHGKNQAGDVKVPVTKCGKWMFAKDTGEKKYIGVE
jgi:hypothetical protein